MYGVGNNLPLPVASRKVKTKALLVSCFSSDFSTRHIEHTLKEQLEILIVMLKTKFNTYAPFHTSVMEEDVPLIYSTRVWAGRCLTAAGRCLTAPFYGHLNPNQIFNSDSQVTVRPLADGMDSSLAVPASGPVVDEAHGGGTVPTN